MFTLKNQPQDRFSVLEQGFSLYTRTLPFSLPYSLLGATCLSIPEALILHPFTVSPIEQKMGMLTGLALCWIFGLVLFSALIFRLDCFLNKIQCSFFNSLRRAFRKLLPLLMLSGLYSLIVLGGTMMLVIPGIIFAFSMMFSFILIITSNQKVLQTLITSHRLVWGQWWHATFIMCIPLLIALTVSLITFLFAISILMLEGTTVATVYLYTFLLNTFIQSLLIPLTLSIALVLLHDLRQRQNKIPQW